MLMRECGHIYGMVFARSPDTHISSTTRTPRTNTRAYMKVGETFIRTTAWTTGRMESYTGTYICLLRRRARWFFQIGLLNSTNNENIGWETNSRTSWNTYRWAGWVEMCADTCLKIWMIHVQRNGTRSDKPNTRWSLYVVTEWDMECVTQETYPNAGGTQAQMLALAQVQAIK
jgi:hypothetical protein